jgi:hypothetical protein
VTLFFFDGKSTNIGHRKSRVIKARPKHSSTDGVKLSWKGEEQKVVACRVTIILADIAIALGLRREMTGTEDEIKLLSPRFSLKDRKRRPEEGE